MRYLLVLAGLLALTSAQAEDIIKPENSVWDTAAPGACAKAIYPQQSQLNEETGFVALTFHIGLDGRVIDSEVIRSSSFPLLDEASRDIIMSCVFPLKANKKPALEFQKVGYKWALS